MMPPPDNEPVSFRDEISAGPFKWPFMIFIGLMFTGFIGAAVLNSMSPASYFGSAGTGEQIAFVVKDSTIQPVTISVAHTFPILVVKSTPTPDNPDGYIFTVIDGLDPVYYNITIDNDKDDTIYSRSEKISMPRNIYRDEDTHKYTVKNTHFVQLRPGTYILGLQGSATLDYKIIERSAYSGITTAMAALGVISIFVLVIIYVLVREEPKRRARKAAASPGGTYSLDRGAAPSPEYVPPALQDLRAQSWEQARAASPDPARRSTLEYAPGQFYAVIVCTNCGFSIHNPPMNGVVMCEHCGAPGYIG